jgi:outer membrane protein OmpA-like peptidoglycan-associated protein
MIFEVTGWKGQAGLRDVDFDLFISFQLPDGSWTPAQPLSPVINTANMERSPFLHPDMRTLYFSTNARGGLGQMDVYKTTRIGDGWFCWSEPVHLGRAVNTPGHDWGYKVTTNGQYAYFAGNARSSTKSEQNIYQVELPQAARPDPVTLIETRILAPDGKPIDGALQVEDLETGEIIMTLRTEPGTGRVTAPLPNNRRYALVFEDGRRLPLSNTIDLSKVDSSQTVTQDVVLKAVEELKAGEGLVLNNIFFDYGEAILKPESRAEIRRAAEFLKNAPEAIVEIAGHTDNTSSREFNLSLSARRAESVRNALIQQGIDPARLSARGYGPDQPVAPNDTEAGRAANRRVEMKWQQ